MITSIPVCYYPLQKVLLDDDQAFSQSILLKMHGNNFLSFHSPNEALNYLLNEYKPALTIADFISSDPNITNSPTQRTININIDALKKMLNKSSHNDISVLFVDYHMPEMYGSEFLEKIKHLPIKKALITGENDYKIAVDAFNNGLVDTYIRKDDPDFSNKLKSTLSDLEWEYFAELSSLVTNISDFSYLRNSHFASEFNQYINENHITAFCLTNAEGNFLLKDKYANQQHLIIRSRSQLQELAKIAKDDNGSTETINNLNNGNIIPFFGDKEYWEIPAGEWDGYMHTAKSLQDDKDFIWTIIKS